MTGTNSGPFGNMPATNKPVKFNGVDIIQIKDGKATDRWGLTDDLSMLSQMGRIETELFVQHGSGT
jgi:predicted ester cyclase